tara:strand:+ start:2505 stop:3329 length:825 start_codon:yes stop_codon:yes gene_type:complete
MRYKVIILTGNELRHQYFRTILSNEDRFDVVSTISEDTRKSLGNRTKNNPYSSLLESQHVLAREQSEQDMFGDSVSLIPDKSNPIVIPKGTINDEQIVQRIYNYNPDILVCYGSSIIKSSLLRDYSKRFLNVHLGLSPYYRGSGTNVWPLINREPHMVGATFMHINEGIDTGHIVHQIRAQVFIGDSPHSIGNRLIKQMTTTYSNLIANFDQLTEESQPNSPGQLYRQHDFDAKACEDLYKAINSTMIESYLSSLEHNIPLPYIVQNRGLPTTL